VQELFAPAQRRRPQQDSSLHHRPGESGTKLLNLVKSSGKNSNACKIVGQ
jgi:hypothetical protein